MQNTAEWCLNTLEYLQPSAWARREVMFRRCLRLDRQGHYNLIISSLSGLKPGQVQSTDYTQKVCKDS